MINRAASDFHQGFVGGTRQRRSAGWQFAAFSRSAAYDPPPGGRQAFSDAS